jgi:hypothetical protein
MRPPLHSAVRSPKTSPVIGCTIIEKTIAAAAAFVAMGVIALMLISGPWSPRVVEKDAAGEVVGGPPRPLAPGTTITTAPVPAEATR